MSNIAINTALSNKPIPVADNKTNAITSNFDDFLQKEKVPLFPSASQPYVMPTLSGKMTMPDGEVINIEPVKATVYSHEESIQMLQESGLSRAEAEALLAPVDLSSMYTKEQTPEEYKAYLQSKQVDAVAYDANGRVAAKIYKDGSLMCDNCLMGQMSKCNTNAEKIRLLQSQNDISVVDYSQKKITDFDLLKGELAWLQKVLILHPEKNTQDTLDNIEFQKRVLAL